MDIGWIQEFKLLKWNQYIETNKKKTLGANKNQIGAWTKSWKTHLHIFHYKPKLGEDSSLRFL